MGIINAIVFIAYAIWAVHLYAAFISEYHMKRRKIDTRKQVLTMPTHNIYIREADGTRTLIGRMGSRTVELTFTKIDPKKYVK